MRKEPTAPAPLAWSHGLAIRVVTLHLMPGALMLRHAPGLLVLWLVVTEGSCWLLHRRARDGERPTARHALSWMTFSDMTCAALALAAAGLSAQMPAWGYAALLGIWALGLGVQAWIGLTRPLPRKANPAFPGSEVSASPAASPAQQKLEKLVSTYAATGVAVGGLLLVMFGYAQQATPMALIGLAVMMMGVALAAAAQSRAVILAWRIRDLSK